MNCWLGEPAATLWLKDSVDLPCLITSYKPQLRDLTKQVVGTLASMGGGLVGFVFSFIVAGVIMAWCRECLPHRHAYHR